MSKIIRLTESDLTRIVRQVKNNQQQPKLRVMDVKEDVILNGLCW
jgi:hypothetical protein